MEVAPAEEARSGRVEHTWYRAAMCEGGDVRCLILSCGACTDGRISLDEFMACTDATSSGDELEVGNKHGKLLPGEASFAFAEALRVSRVGAAHKAGPQQGRVPVATLVHVWSTVHARLSVLPALSYHMPDASAVANRNTMASRMRALVDHLNSAWPWQHHTERLADDNPASPMA